MKASTLFLLGALGAVTACVTETRIIQGSPDPALPSEAPPAGDEDAAPPVPGEEDTDAGTTTKPKDGGGGADAKPPTPPASSDVGRVHCSLSGTAFYCQAGAVCCVQNAVKGLNPIVVSCETFNGCKSLPDPVPLVCDGPEDCKTGEHCFGLTTPSLAIASLCSTTPISAEWKRLCNPGQAGECVAGETCVPTTSGPAIGVCR